MTEAWQVRPHTHIGTPITCVTYPMGKEHEDIHTCIHTYVFEILPQIIAVCWVVKAVGDSGCGPLWKAVGDRCGKAVGDRCGKAVGDRCGIL